MKQTIRFIMDIEIDSDNKQLNFLNANIQNNPRFLSAKTQEDHIENVKLLLAIHGFTINDLHQTLMRSRSAKHFENSEISFEQLMKNFNAEVKA
jgi:NRPS condensation-like uncharacterized protein